MPKNKIKMSPEQVGNLAAQAPELFDQLDSAGSPLINYDGKNIHIDKDVFDQISALDRNLAPSPSPRYLAEQTILESYDSIEEAIVELLFRDAKKK